MWMILALVVGLATKRRKLRRVMGKSRAWRGVVWSVDGWRVVEEGPEAWQPFEFEL
jgi:hypothetical protein